MLRVFLSLACCSVLVNSQVFIEPPSDFQECLTSVTMKTRNMTSEGIAMTSPDEIEMYCWQQFLWAPDKVNWSEFNITEEQMDIVNEHLRSLVQQGRRNKRFVGMRKFPPSGFRIRREYRRLSFFERMAFHRAVNDLKNSPGGRYDAFAALHTGMAIAQAHGGPNFLSWHRVYLAVVEEALREYNPFVSIPYWDSSMDFDMVEPANSIVWSHWFLGNGDGFVTTGPFANWPTASGALTRNIAGGSRLISKEVIADILTRCQTEEITSPTALPQYNLEFAHNGVHVWVGGQMVGILTSPQDPVFFLHHAFIDYLWELFRIRQAFVCGINPATDYPPTVGPHAPDNEMEGFPSYRNIDGFSNIWTMFWYRYERSPTCSVFMPFCWSPYLRCDVTRGRCVSIERSFFSGTGGGKMGFGARRIGPSTPNSRLRGAMEAASINVGPRFVGPPSDGRTTDVMARGRFRRAAPATPSNSAARNESNQSTTSLQFGPLFKGPPADVRPKFRPGMSVDQTSQQLPYWANQNQFSASLPLLPSIDFSIVQNVQTNSQSQYRKNENANDNDMKTFIPVQVAYMQAPRSLNTRLHFMRNIMSSVNSSAQVSPYPECRPHPTGNTKVTIQTNGINYMGTYTNTIQVDTRISRSTMTTYVRINAPINGQSEVMLSAFHECGLMCQPACALPGASPARYTACTGILKLAQGDGTLLHGPTLEAALGSMNRGTRQMAAGTNKEPFISFQCSNADVSPLSQLAYNPIWGM